MANEARDKVEININQIEFDDMKRIIKRYVDSANISDAVSFSVHYDKARGEAVFTKSIEILIDTDVGGDSDERE